MCLTFRAILALIVLSLSCILAFPTGENANDQTATIANSSAGNGENVDGTNNNKRTASANGISLETTQISNFSKQDDFTNIKLLNLNNRLIEKENRSSLENLQEKLLLNIKNKLYKLQLNSGSQTNIKNKKESDQPQSYKLRIEIPENDDSNINIEPSNNIPLSIINNNTRSTPYEDNKFSIELSNNKNFKNISTPVQLRFNNDKLKSTRPKGKENDNEPANSYISFKNQHKLMLQSSEIDKMFNIDTTTTKSSKSSIPKIIETKKNDKNNEKDKKFANEDTDLSKDIKNQGTVNNHQQTFKEIKKYKKNKTVIQEVEESSESLNIPEEYPTETVDDETTKPTKKRLQKRTPKSNKPRTSAPEEDDTESKEKNQDDTEDKNKPDEPNEATQKPDKDETKKPIKEPKDMKEPEMNTSTTPASENDAAKPNEENDDVPKAEKDSEIPDNTNDSPKEPKKDESEKPPKNPTQNKAKKYKPTTPSPENDETTPEEPDEDNSEEDDPETPDEPKEPPKKPKNKTPKKPPQNKQPKQNKPTTPSPENNETTPEEPDEDNPEEDDPETPDEPKEPPKRSKNKTPKKPPQNKQPKKNRPTTPSPDNDDADPEEPDEDNPEEDDPETPDESKEPPKKPKNKTPKKPPQNKQSKKNKPTTPTPENDEADPEEPDEDNPDTENDPETPDEPKEPPMKSKNKIPKKPPQNKQPKKNKPTTPSPENDETEPEEPGEDNPDGEYDPETPDEPVERPKKTTKKRPQNKQPKRNKPTMPSSEDVDIEPENPHTKTHNLLSCAQSPNSQIQRPTEIPVQRTIPTSTNKEPQVETTVKPNLNPILGNPSIIRNSSSPNITVLFDNRFQPDFDSTTSIPTIDDGKYYYKKPEDPDDNGWQGAYKPGVNEDGNNEEMNGEGLYTTNLPKPFKFDEGTLGWPFPLAPPYGQPPLSFRFTPSQDFSMFVPYHPFEGFPHMPLPVNPFFSTSLNSGFGSVPNNPELKSNWSSNPFISDLLGPFINNLTTSSDTITEIKSDDPNNPFIIKTISGSFEPFDKYGQKVMPTIKIRAPWKIFSKPIDPSYTNRK